MIASRERPLNLPGMFCALCVAAAVAYFAFRATTPLGDPAATVAQIEQAVIAPDGVLAPHAFHLQGAQAPEPASTSRALYRMSGAKGELLFLEGPAGLPRSEAERIFAELYSSGSGRYISADSALADVTRLTSRLVPENRRVARAMALRQFQTKPRGISEQEWRERLPDSLALWTIEELSSFQLRRGTYAVGAAFTGFAVMVLLLGITRALGGARSRRLLRKVPTESRIAASTAD